jgi:hypothetical protein
MAAPIIFEKNKIDLDLPGVTITVTDAVATETGQAYVDLVRNRRNDSGWGTGGSSDAANTTLVIETQDANEIDSIFLINHNFKAYTLKYWNGSSFVDFSTVVNQTANQKTTTYHSFNAVQTTRVQLVITGTMTADQDKLLAQVVLTKQIGQFNNEPHVKKPRQEKGRKVRKMLSGRSNITRSLGAFTCALSFPAMKDADDMALIERMFDSFNGFLVWLHGDDDTQFFTDVQGFRPKDLYLMNCVNDLESEWNGGYFDHGQKLEIQLAESRV